MNYATARDFAAFWNQQEVSFSFFNLLLNGSYTVKNRNEEESEKDGEQTKRVDCVKVLKTACDGKRKTESVISIVQNRQLLNKFWIRLRMP